MGFVPKRFQGLFVQLRTRNVRQIPLTDSMYLGRSEERHVTATASAVAICNYTFSPARHPIASFRDKGHSQSSFSVFSFLFHLLKLLVTFESLSPLDN